MSDKTQPTDTPRRILVIDDEEVVHASLRRILGRLGLAVETVFSAADGLARLEQEPFDLVITDLMMPKMSGIELLEALQDRDLHPPILMITGYPTIKTAVEALRLGAMDYLAKPYTRKELLAPVKRALWIDEQGADAELRKQEAAPAAEALKPSDIVVLPHHAWAQFQQDGTFLVGVERSFLKASGTVVSCECPDEMDLIEQGYIAIRLLSAEGDVHGIAMPLSGQVLEVNTALMSDDPRFSAEAWLLRILPSQLSAELELLVARSG